MSNPPAIATAGGSIANKVTNFVGKVVNGFEIQKLIGKPHPAEHPSRSRKVFLRLSRQALRRQCACGTKIDQSKPRFLIDSVAQIFDMENKSQRDNCLKEVQLHQVSLEPI